MSILTPPLSKRGILKALGQDPSKSDVLTVSTNPDGVVKLVGGGGAIVTLDRLGASFVDNVGAANPTGSDLRGIAAASHQPISNPRCAGIIKKRGHLPSFSLHIRLRVVVTTRNLNHLDLFLIALANF
jgi:hypothetical protein